MAAFNAFMKTRDMYQGTTFSRAGPEFTRVVTTEKETLFQSAKGERAAPGVGAKRL